MNKIPSIKTKLLQIIISLSLLFGLFSAIFIYYYSNSIITDNLINDQEYLTIEKANKMEEIFRQNENIAGTISDQNEIKEYLAGSEQSLQDENILNILERYNIADQYSSIYLMNLEGEALVSTDPSFVGKNYGFREYFQKAVDGEPSIQASVGVTSKKLGYYFSYPVEKSGNIVGVVVCKLDPETVTIQDISEDVNLMIINENGIIIYSEENDKEFKSLGAISLENQKSIDDKKSFEEIDIIPLNYNDLNEDLVEGKISNDVAYYVQYNEIDKKDELLTTQKIADTNFYVVVEANLDDVKNQSFRISAILVSVIIVAAILATILMMYLAKSAINPAQELTKKFKLASKGKFDIDIDLNKYKIAREIYEIAESFSKLTKKLLDYQKNTEKKISERTQNLEQINDAMVGREIRIKELKEENKKLKDKLNIEEKNE